MLIIKTLFLFFISYILIVNCANLLQGDEFCVPFGDIRNRIDLPKDTYSVNCYLNVIKSIGIHNCNWDNNGTNKHEGGRNQTSSVSLFEYISVFKNLKDKKASLIVGMYQYYFGETGDMLVFNKNEHLAFFQVGIDIRNEVQEEYNCGLKDNLVQSNRSCFILLSSYPHTSIKTTDIENTFEVNKNVKFGWLGGISVDANDKGVSANINAGVNGGREKGNKETVKESYTLKEWDIIYKGDEVNTEWSIYQQSPFNSLTDKPRNFQNSWLPKVANRHSPNEKRIFNGDLPVASKSTTQGCLFSLYEFPYVENNNNGDDRIVRMGSSIKQTLGDMVVGSVIDWHNSYRTYTHGKIDIKHFNIDTGTLEIPIKTQEIEKKYIIYNENQ